MMKSSSTVQIHHHHHHHVASQQQQQDERISPELAKLNVYQQDDDGNDNTNEVNNSLKRLMVNGCKAQMIMRKATSTTNNNNKNKRLRSESEEDETEPDGSWSYDKEWQYEPPPNIRNNNNGRRFAARRNSKVASMLQIASMMDATSPPCCPDTETQPPRHRYKRRNSVVDGMLQPSTRQYLMERQEDSPFVVVPTTGHMFQRSSLPWNFKPPGVSEHHGHSSSSPPSMD